MSNQITKTVNKDDIDLYTPVAESMVDHTRWHVHYEVIVRDDDGVLWSYIHERGATEHQEDGDVDEDEIELTQVEAYEKTVTAYRAVEVAS